MDSVRGDGGGLRIGSLFSGYGGLDLGVQAVLGGEVAWHVEFDAAPSKILAHHWPDVPNYGDVTSIDWTSVPPVDVLTAGYPCQPFSLSGKRKGANDARHLWPYVLDAVRHLRPRYVVLENVRGHLSMGFDRVLGDLAEAGYDADWLCVPAAAAGAPHRRERVFILAYPADLGQERPRSAWDGWNGLENRGDLPPDPASARRAEGEDGSSGSGHAGEGARSLEPERTGRERARFDWGAYATAVEQWESVIGRSAPAPTVDGRLSPEFVEWMMGLPAGHVTGVDITRAQQIKALGNGVVPQHAALALSMLLSHSSLPNRD